MARQSSLENRPLNQPKHNAHIQKTIASVCLYSVLKNLKKSDGYFECAGMDLKILWASQSRNCMRDVQ